MEILFGKRKIVCKLVLCGDALCGKTTNVMSMFDRLPPAQRLTEKVMEIPTEADKTLKYECTQVSFGKHFGFDVVFGIYTVPGQIFYKESRKLILKNVDGIIFVADSQPSKMDNNIRSLTEVQQHLMEMNRQLYSEVPLVLQFNKQDLPDAMNPVEMRAKLQFANSPFITASAITGKGVTETFDKMVEMVKSNIKRKEVV